MMNSTNSATHNSILYKSSSNNNNNNGRRNNGTFGTDGCQVLIDGKKCGETKNLQIIREFRQLYEDKMRLIDDIAGGDSIQAKVNLQQEWIKDLTDQNEMLVKVVEELEVEAAERVTMLERKLEQSAKCACKVMESYRHFSTNFLGDLQKMDIVQSDLNNLVELVRRAKRDGVWNIDGLRFDSLNINDVLRTSAEQLQLGDRKQQTYQKEDTLKERDRRIRELERQLQPYLDEDSRTQRDSQSLKEEYAELEKSMLDMRDALTAEVADKYDTIVCLRREVHLLEEQCRKSDQQTHFKDDIIKELRKELKQHKQFQLQDDADMVRFRKTLEGNHLILRHKRRVKSHIIVKQDKEVQTIIEEDLEISHEPQASTLACRNAPKIQVSKDKYIVDQNALIILLVQKLYMVYRCLRELESKLTFMFTDGKPDGKLMEEAIIDAKNKLAELEERSLVYLKERDALRLQNDEHILTIETLQKEIAAYKDNLRKSMENLIETQRELVKSKDDVERERGKSKTSVERSTNEPDEVESELIRENSALKEIATALKQESEVLAMENSTMKHNLQELEDRHSSQMDEVHHILITELENLEAQHQETLKQLERLRSELQDAKEAHQICMKKIEELGYENEELKKQIQQKPDNLGFSNPDECPEYTSDLSCDCDFANNCGVKGRISTDSTNPCVSADATVNTDSTWTGLVTCEDSDGQKETATGMEKKPLAIFTFSNSYMDTPPRERVKGGASKVDTYPCSEECTPEAEDVAIRSVTVPTERQGKILEVLELLGPKKLSVGPPKKASSQQPCVLTVEKSSEKELDPNKVHAITVASYDKTSSISLPAKMEAFEAGRIISTKSYNGVSNDTLDGRYKIADDATSSNMLVATVPQKRRAQSSRKRSTSSPGVDQDYYERLAKDILTDPECTTFATSTPTMKQQNELLEASPQSCDAPCQVLYQKDEKAVNATIICDAEVYANANVDELTQYSHLTVELPLVMTRSAMASPVRFARSAQAVGANPVSLQCGGIAAACTNTTGDQNDLQDSCNYSVEDERSQMSEVAYDANLDYYLTGRASDDLKDVVKDLNESASRILEKPTEREAKARMKYLEDQLRHALMQKEQAVEYERQRRGQEVENLKLTIHQMDIALKNKDLNSTNLQSAVDLHANTVNVLEQAEERYRTEIAQQRVTITNLQDALVATKQELEELREKFKQDVSQGWAARWFGASGPNAQDDHNKSVHEV